VRLRRVDPADPGIRRVRRGKGFSYVDADGKAVDKETRQRIQDLVIPPAWTDVWICPLEHGHIQAVGTDQAGRRQYLYHPDWHEAQARDKHQRVRRLARKLPEVRKVTRRDLAKPGRPRERVLAAALRMLDAGLFRSGGDQYERDNGSHGVATLQRDHVTVRGNTVEFCFPAKSGVEREAMIEDAGLAKAVRTLKRGGSPKGRLLSYQTPAGWHDVTSADINAYFKEIAGDEFTVKDLRTWGATVLAAVLLAEMPGVDVTIDEATDKEREKAQREAVRLVAEHLGNTPAVARASYVDPQLIDKHDEGVALTSAWKRSLTLADRRRLEHGELANARKRDAVERAVLRMLSR
jgi:DNA topoisomerase IB